MENIDFEKMMKLAKMFKLMNNNNTNEKKDKQEDKKEPANYIIPFDEEIQTPAIKTIKAAIPYLEYKYQKNMGIMVKIIELDNLMKKYKEVSIKEENSDEHWKKNMLLSVRNYVEKEKQPIIDMLIKFMDINDILKTLKEAEINNEN